MVLHEAVEAGSSPTYLESLADGLELGEDLWVGFSIAAGTF